MTSRPIVFLDTECDSLNPYTRQAWEFGCILRMPEGDESRHQFFIDIPLTDSDPASLKIGGYYERHPRGRVLSNAATELAPAESPRSAALLIAAILTEATIVGAQPHFDTITLEKLLHDHGLQPTWHYRLRCVESLAAGYLRKDDLGGLAGCAEALGIEVPEGAAHTAVGDAETAMAIYDAVFKV